ncbi:tripartite tricarboxylate transporter TctB family protein [Pseudonocardia acaciae]|uniref:tripartite tricarboxylate transporter TctB family protein n=1 Tax=Pseudonocardia acaciae TaxID=551276 RepID=UPI00048AF1BC|nr:tripartite tricarboxylate transporter TctB family protein [Pseudonocardia acaciae]
MSQESGHADLVAGLLAAALGAGVLVMVQGFPELPAGQPGPALFPGIVGALLVLFGLVLTGRSALTFRRAASESPAVVSSPRGRLNALAVLGAVAGYLALAETLGFVLTMAPLLFLLMWRLGTRPLVAAGASVLTTGVIWVLFQHVLLVPLPIGLVG